MDQGAYKTIPLDVAMEYYTDANRRGRTAGTILERQRIMDLLKKNGQYTALFLIKQSLEDNAD